ncbi:hypothetical protein GGP77_003447, partial [Salinibacter ruber]
MNPPKVDDLDYIHFLVAAQKEFTCTEAARSSPEEEDAPAHDAFTRLLQRQPPNTEALWREAEPVVEPDAGLLILDDTTLDKPYANEIEHVTWHWSGKHGDVVKGINLLTLLWRSSSEEPTSEEPTEEASPEKSSREAHVPCDFRLYEKEGKTKNEHFREMLDKASEHALCYGSKHVCSSIQTFQRRLLSPESLIDSIPGHVGQQLRHNPRHSSPHRPSPRFLHLELVAEGA